METGTVMIHMMLLVLAVFMDKSNSQCSVFNYTTLPPSPLGCNPFSNGPTPLWRLRTKCSAVASTKSIDRYEIHWMHRFPNGTIEDMGTLENAQFNNMIPIATSFFGDENVDRPFNEDMLGQYWCQVFSPAGNPMPLPAYSDELTILRSEEYDIQLATCPSRIQIDTSVSICNDLPPVGISPTTSQSNVPMTISMPVTTSVPVLATTTSPISIAITITESSIATATPSALSPSITAISPITTLIKSTATVSTIGSIKLMSTTALEQSINSTSTTFVQSIIFTSRLTLNTFISKPSSQNTPSTIHSSPSQDSSNPSNNDQTTVSPTSTTTGTGTVPEERLNEEMSYLLITAIALIVVLSIIIILLLVIAYLMKCGRKSVGAQARKKSVKKRSHLNFSRLSSIRSSRAELLENVATEIEIGGNGLQTGYINANSMSSSCHGPHEYVDIDNAQITSSRRDRGFHYPCNLPPVKPPAIIRSATFAKGNNHQVAHGNENDSFTYAQLTSREHSDSMYTECIANEQDEDGKIDTNSDSNKLTSTAGESNEGKVMKLKQTSEEGKGQLENWDYEVNPMYMKIPVGMRVINTL